MAGDVVAEVFDIEVARAVARMRALERALHDPGPWTVRVGERVYPACRQVLPESRCVLFYAYLWDGPTGVADLYCRDLLVASQPLEEPTVGRLTWELGLQEVRV